MRVFVEEKDCLRVFSASREKIGVKFQLRNGVRVHMINAATPTDGKETTILVGHLDQIGKERPSTGCRHRTLVSSITKSPELLSIVPTQEVGIGLEEVFEGFEVVVLDVRMASRSRLAREPHAVLLTD